MTLVVARIDGNDIYIESDSRITDPSRVRSDPLCGLLKTAIIHPFVSVSFAGNVHFAELALRRIFDDEIEGVGWLTKCLLDVSRESDGATDFIVASIIDRVPRLTKISEGIASSDLDNAWIGDQIGFGIYQETYHGLGAEVPVKERMRVAFKALLDSGRCSTVGDFHISTHTDYDLCIEHPVFTHAMKAEIIVMQSQAISFEEVGQSKAIPLGTAAGGAYGVSYLVTVSPEFHGVAVHFPHGNFGVLFCTKLGMDGILIREVNGLEFVEEIKRRYGIPLQGLVMASPSRLQFIDSRR